jgi:hypothetical protein
MKVIGVAIGLVLLLVIGVFVYVAYNTNSIVKNAIETIGPQYLDAPVRVKDVDISLQDGRGTLTNLEVGNPAGYEGPYAVRVGTVSVTLDVAHSTSGLVVLKRVTIDGARVAAIAKSAKETNLRTLSSNVPASKSSSPIKLIIDELDVTNTQAAVSSPLLSRALEVNVPDVHLKDIGRSTGGADVGTVINQVLAPITKAVTRSLSEAGLQSLGVDPNRLKSDAAQRMNDALQSLGHPRN